ncbi:Lytic polysaccharide monooxygenase [Mycena venus]|uniref:lytic cellulose monooxygenase (C4-dehydrogenating) n=1 Tax=Mycena venus TaxID=2733690 RepID=A0A8H6TZ52_9AGAR|nr:Lytic polysaccharide monooxygenase [Mycena venus]
MEADIIGYKSCKSEAKLQTLISLCMQMLTFAALALSSLFSHVQAHYTFPSLIVNGVTTPAWANVRETNNFNSQAPVTDVTSADFRCYDSATAGTASTITVAAGSTLGIACDQTIYHPGVVNVYMAKAPGNVSTFAGDGAVWFKVYQITATTNGGSSISFPAQSLRPPERQLHDSEIPSNWAIPRAHGGPCPPRRRNVPREVSIHLIHCVSGSSNRLAQWYISCGQISVTGGGSGTPGPLVSIPGVYTGNEPGILINIYYPVPATYTQPGPAV